jgi:hypothetical protein
MLCTLCEQSWWVSMLHRNCTNDNVDVTIFWQGWSAAEIMLGHEHLLPILSGVVMVYCVNACRLKDLVIRWICWKHMSFGRFRWFWENGIFGLQWKGMMEEVWDGTQGGGDVITGRSYVVLMDWCCLLLKQVVQSWRLSWRTLDVWWPGGKFTMSQDGTKNHAILSL